MSNVANFQVRYLLQDNAVPGASTIKSVDASGVTNWAQVHALYRLLERIAPNPIVTLNRAIALAETEGPEAGLTLLAALDGDDRMARHHRLLSVRAHLLERAGDTQGAYEHYRRAAKATASLAEQRYLQARAARLSGGTSGGRAGPGRRG